MTHGRSAALQPLQLCYLFANLYQRKIREEIGDEYDEIHYKLCGNLFVNFVFFYSYDFIRNVLQSHKCMAI
jgi:hypothetical protein